MSQVRRAVRDPSTTPSSRGRRRRAEAAKTNKAAADEAMRKIKTLVGDQDAADAKPSEEGIRNPAKWDKASE